MTEKAKPIYYVDVSRECKTAVSYIWRSVRAIDGYAKQTDSRFGLLGFGLLGSESLLAWNLQHIIDATFEASLAVVDVFDDDDLERLEKDAKEYASRLRRARVARKLADTSGRTPAEAEAFLAASARLKGGTK